VSVLQFVAVCGVVCGIVCCGVLRCVAVCCGVLRYIFHSDVWDAFQTVLSGECVACVASRVVVCRRVLQCVAVCCGRCCSVCCSWCLYYFHSECQTRRKRHLKLFFQLPFTQTVRSIQNDVWNYSFEWLGWIMLHCVLQRVVVYCRVLRYVLRCKLQCVLQYVLQLIVIFLSLGLLDASNKDIWNPFLGCGVLVCHSVLYCFGSAL